MAGIRRFAAALGALLLASGCSSVPDAVNPMEWYRSATSPSGKAPAPPKESDPKMAEAQAGASPNLASVPARPTRASTAAERQSLTQGLVADRDNAKYTDDDLQPKLPPAQPSPAARPASPASVAAPEPPKAPAPAVVAPAPAAPPVVAAVPPPAPPPPPAVTPAPPPVAAPAPAAPAPATPPPASAPTAQPVPPPPPPVIAPVAQPTPAPAARVAAPPSVAPAPQTAAASPRPAAPATPPAPTVEQVYRQQLARSEGQVQLRPPAAEPPPPPPAQPRRIGALQHTAREPAKSQVAYIGGGVPAPAAIRPGEPVATIRFGEGSARLSGGDRETLARVVAMAQELGGRVRVVGHAGRSGGGEGMKSEIAEFSLSLNRANAVAQELMRNGVPADRLAVEAVGDAEPLVVAGSAAAEAPNRRAEVFID